MLDEEMVVPSSYRVAEVKEYGDVERFCGRDRKLLRCMKQLEPVKKLDESKSRKCIIAQIQPVRDRWGDALDAFRLFRNSFDAELIDHVDYE